MCVYTVVVEQTLRGAMYNARSNGMHIIILQYYLRGSINFFVEVLYNYYCMMWFYLKIHEKPYILQLLKAFSVIIVGFSIVICIIL